MTVATTICCERLSHPFLGGVYAIGLTPRPNRSAPLDVKCKYSSSFSLDVSGRDVSNC
jgi:hypothetical protein